MLYVSAIFALLILYFMWVYYHRQQRIAECEHDLEYEHIRIGHFDWRTRAVCKLGCGFEELIR